MNTRITLCDVRGLLNDLNDKLSGEEGSEWMQELKKFLRKETTWEPCSWPISKTIKLGTGLKTADDFRGALKKDGYRMGDWANDIIGKPAFTASKTETEVELVVLTVAELGFKDGATRKDIYDRALERGLELCPSEVGPQLRLQYKDQPKSEWLVIAMDPITGSDGDLNVFFVGHDEGAQWLFANYGGPGLFWFADDRFVFVRRK